MAQRALHTTLLRERWVWTFGVGCTQSKFAQVYVNRKLFLHDFLQQLRHSVAQITHSSRRPPQRPTLFTAVKRISLNSKTHNLKPSTRRPRQAWKRKSRWWICSATTTYLRCSPNNSHHPPTQVNSKRFNRKISSRRIKFSSNRFLHLFVIQIQLHPNVIAHLITYHLILI